MTELDQLKSGMDAVHTEVEAVQTKPTVDAKLVAASFAVKNLARCFQRLKALESKASEAFLNRHGAVVKSMHDRKEKMVASLLVIKGQGVWAMLKDSLFPFMKGVLLQQPTDATTVAKVTETLKGRVLRQALALPSTSDFGRLQERTTLSVVDAKFDSLANVVEAMLSVTANIEWKDTCTVGVDIFSGEWESLLRAMVDGGCFNSGSSDDDASFPGVPQLEVSQHLDELRKAIVSKIQVVTGDLVTTVPWLHKFLQRLRQGPVWPQAQDVPEDAECKELETKFKMTSEFLAALDPDCKNTDLYVPLVHFSLLCKLAVSRADISAAQAKSKKQQDLKKIPQQESSLLTYANRVLELGERIQKRETAALCALMDNVQCHVNHCHKAMHKDVIDLFRRIVKESYEVATVPAIAFNEEIDSGLTDAKVCLGKVASRRVSAVSIPG